MKKYYISWKKIDSFVKENIDLFEDKTAIEIGSILYENGFTNSNGVPLSCDSIYTYARIYKTIVVKRHRRKTSDGTYAIAKAFATSFKQIIKSIDYVEKITLNENRTGYFFKTLNGHVSLRYVRNKSQFLIIVYNDLNKKSAETWIATDQIVTLQKMAFLYKTVKKEII